MLKTFLLVGAVFAGALMWWWIATYNEFVKLGNLVEASWKQIDVQLQRRHDLVPNLVGAVKGYAAHEKEVLAAVTSARAAALAARGPAAQAPAEGALDAAIARLLAIAEAYPDLKASSNFLHLQEELADSENRVAAARRIYQSNVRDYNTKQKTVPSVIVAKQMSLAPAEYFDADVAARDVPEVSF